MPKSLPLRAELLDNAKLYVTKERNKSYGEPDEDFQRIAAIASAMGFRVLKTVQRPDGDTSEFVALTGSDVSRFMIALKLSRLAWMPTHEDSWTDIAGYAACGYETALLEQSRSDAARMLEVKSRPVYLKDVVGHQYDGCPVCANKRAENRDLIV